MQEICLAAVNASLPDAAGGPAQTIRFVPDHWVSTYNHWLENVHDWCISRQLWWGHRIPVWTKRITDADFTKLGLNQADADYFAFEFISDPNISPDGKLVAYVITKIDRAQNRRNSSIWMVATDGSRPPWQCPERRR